MAFKKLKFPKITNTKHVLIMVKIGFVLLVIITVAFGINELFLYDWNKDNNPNSDFFLDFSKIGHLGDFIGGLIGSLWALTGVLLFYQAMRDQQKATQLISKQVSDQRLLQFETVLFNLFNNYSSRISSLKFLGNQTLIGDDIFKEIVNEAVPLKFKDKHSFRESYKKKIYKKYYSEIHTMVDGLESILNYIQNIEFSDESSDESSESKKSFALSNEKKMFYGNFIRSQLTLDHLAVVLYECACNDDSDNLVYLVDKYEILSDKELIDQRINQGSNFKAQAIWEMHWEIAESL